VDPVGDVALRESFRGMVGSLLEPCGGTRDFRPFAIPAIAATTPPSSGGGGQTPRDDRLPLWLALGALAALGSEQFVRGRRRATA
jgi:hypothetical protein